MFQNTLRRVDLALHHVSKHVVDGGSRPLSCFRTRYGGWISPSIMFRNPLRRVDLALHYMFQNTLRRVDLALHHVSKHVVDGGSCPLSCFRTHYGGWISPFIMFRNPLRNVDLALYYMFQNTLWIVDLALYHVSEHVMEGRSRPPLYVWWISPSIMFQNTLWRVDLALHHFVGVTFVHWALYIPTFILWLGWSNPKSLQSPAVWVDVISARHRNLTVCPECCWRWHCHTVLLTMTLVCCEPLTMTLVCCEPLTMTLVCCEAVMMTLVCCEALTITLWHSAADDDTVCVVSPWRWHCVVGLWHPAVSVMMTGGVCHSVTRHAAWCSGRLAEHPPIYIYIYS